MDSIEHVGLQRHGEERKDAKASTPVSVTILISCRVDLAGGCCVGHHHLTQKDAQYLVGRAGKL